MDELIRLVSEKAGIPEEQARTAVTTVLGFLKEKLPPPMAGQLDAVIAGGSAGSVADVARGLGGLFGKK